MIPIIITDRPVSDHGHGNKSGYDDKPNKPFQNSFFGINSQINDIVPKDSVPHDKDRDEGEVSKRV